MVAMTVRDKYVEVKRELALRRRLYPRWVAEGKLPEREASRRIAVLHAIMEDYERELAAAEPELAL